MLKHTFVAVTALVLSVGAASAEATRTIDPALYAVRDADSTMYLYGTVHVRPNGADWADDDVRRALGESQEVWTEIEISPEAEARGQALALELGRAPQGQGLSTQLNEDERARLAALLQRLGMPEAALEPYRPWMAALTLTLVPIMQAGYNPQSGVDRAVDAFAEAGGIPLRALETVEEQLGFLSGFSAELQAQMLRDAIDDAEAGPGMLAEMSEAWERGDIEMLTTLVVESTRVEYPELYEVLFVRRNANWLPILEAELAGAGVDFVAVGAGHLGGSDGLVELLRARGFSVERVGVGQ